MQTLLIATDFSPAAINAANYAAQLAKVLPANLFLVHVYMLPTPISEMPVVLITADEIQKDNELATRNEASRLATSFEIAVTPMTHIGLPSEEITMAIDACQADLLIMGMKGSENAFDKLVGSTVNAVLRKSKKPVLVVPENAAYIPIHKILYAADYQHEINYNTLKPLLQMASIEGAKVNLLHVENPVVSEKIIQTLPGQKHLENILEHHPHEFFNIENAHVEAGIQQFLYDQPAQILAMVAHRHSFFERLFGTIHTKDMLYKTEIPLLVLKDTP